MDQVNIFAQYKQLENHFTNGLISILALSRIECPALIDSFLKDVLALSPASGVNEFYVLPGKDGTIDGELKGEDCCIWLETKIKSGSLDAWQIHQHLKGNGASKGLRQRTETLRRLVLLTPDDSRSGYIQLFRLIDSQSILHVEWKKVYTFLARFEDDLRPNTLSELIRQFRASVYEMIFTQDMAGVIVKIAFGKKAEVYPDKYLDEMRAGLWTRWNTPRQYKNLDGTGRKLLLYDRVRKAITVEVEIKSVTKTNSEADFPWTNEFAEGTLHILEPPVPLSEIQMVLDKFTKGQSPFRNLTREQYRKLIGHRSDCGVSRP